MESRTLLFSIAAIACLTGEARAQQPVTTLAEAGKTMTAPRGVATVQLALDDVEPSDPGAASGAVNPGDRCFPAPVTGAAAPSCTDTENFAGCADGSCWQIKVVPYGWLYELHGSTTVRGITRGVDVNTHEMLELLEHDVDFVAMGRVEAQHGPLTVYFDGYYVKAGLADHVQGLNFDATFQESIIELCVMYQLKTIQEMLSLPPCSRLEVLAGGRYQMLRGGVTITGPLGNSATFDGKKDWIDPIVGGRITTPLNSRTALQVRGDIGGFGLGNASEFTWNVEALAVFCCSECCDLILGYRILDVDQQRGSGTDKFAFDVQFRGPMAGLVFQF